MSDKIGPGTMLGPCRESAPVMLRRMEKQFSSYARACGAIADMVEKSDPTTASKGIEFGKNVVEEDVYEFLQALRIWEFPRR